jgi:hypothetical protein
MKSDWEGGGSDLRGRPILWGEGKVDVDASQFAGPGSRSASDDRASFFISVHLVL